MRIILSNSTQEAIEAVSMMVLDKLESHPNSVLGLATGKTMEPVYQDWVNRAKDRCIGHQHAFFFMLDEYVGLPENHPSSFKSYIEKFLLTPMGIEKTQVAFPPAALKDGATHYETLLKESGGIDLQLLGIGQNGHVGFNEPGSMKNSRTRIVELTPNTMAANKDQVVGEKMPTTALSMGIGTILEAKSLVMLATGKNKADAIKYLVNHHDDTECPATFLKAHPHFTLVLDPDAASKINLKI